MCVGWGEGGGARGKRAGRCLALDVFGLQTNCQLHLSHVSAAAGGVIEVDGARAITATSASPKAFSLPRHNQQVAANGVPRASSSRSAWRAAPFMPPSK